MPSFTDCSTLDPAGLARFSKLSRGFVKGFAFCVPLGAVFGVHSCNGEGCIHLPLPHRFEYGVNIGGVHLIQIRQDLPSGPDGFVKALEVTFLQVVQGCRSFPPAPHRGRQGHTQGCATPLLRGVVLFACHTLGTQGHNRGSCCVLWGMGCGTHGCHSSCLS